MFILQYFNGKKMIGKFEYPTLDQAQDAIQENPTFHDSLSVNIIDNETGDIEYEEEFETQDSLYQDMFPDEESEEGFDINDAFEED
jgi:hypothetical protein